MEYSVLISLNVPVNDHLKEINRSMDIANDIQTFSNENACLDFIRNHENEKILFITSELFAKSVVPQIHNLPQINSIYVSCSDKEEQNKWAKNYKKVTVIYLDLRPDEKLNEFCRTRVIRIDILERDDECSSPFNEQDNSFMYGQLIKETILKMQDNDIKDMIEYCRTSHNNNEQSLKIITELENSYKKDTVIDWYTRNSFIHDVVNAGLRNQDIDVIYACHVFIRHLHEQLVKLSWETYESPIQLFRGLRITLDELEKIRNNQGRLISFLQFLSTTRKRDVAEAFAGNPSDDSTTAAILFHIRVDFNLEFVAASGIGNFSHIGHDEAEFLFTMGSVFRIKKIEQDSTKIWHIYLSYTGPNDRQLGKLTYEMGKTITNKDPLCQWGRLMYQMGKWDKVEMFYKKAYEIEINWEQRVMILINLGAACKKRLQLEEALKYYQNAIAIGRDYAKDRYHPIFSAVYNNIGLVYLEQQKFNVAEENIKRALQIEEVAPEPNQEYIASTYNSLGLILINRREYNEALKMFKRSLDIFRITLPSEVNEKIAELYNNIALCFAHMTHWPDAIQYGQKAVNIDSRLLPHDHSDAERRRNNLAKYRIVAEKMTLL